MNFMNGILSGLFGRNNNDWLAQQRGAVPQGIGQASKPEQQSSGGMQQSANAAPTPTVPVSQHIDPDKDPLNKLQLDLGLRDDMMKPINGGVNAVNGSSGGSGGSAGILGLLTKLFGF